MSRGPVLPIKCPTVQLSDLADVQDFDKPGTEDTLYGLELNSDGSYVRKEIEEKRQQFPKLQQVRDVDIDKNVDGASYEIIRRGNKWVLKYIPPVIPWRIKMEFLSPYTMVGGGNIFRKSLNQGPLIASLVPKISQSISVRQFRSDQYLISRSPSLDSQWNAHPEFKPEIALGDQWTMIFDIKIQVKNEAVSTILMPGIQLEWGVVTTATRGQLFMQKRNEGEVLSNSYTGDLPVSVKIQNTPSLSFINLNDLSLIAFYYTNEVLPEAVLDLIKFKNNI